MSEASSGCERQADEVKFNHCLEYATAGGIFQLAADTTGNGLEGFVSASRKIFAEICSGF